MKSLDIRFFSPSENSTPKEKNANTSKGQKVTLTGYISGSGKLVLPNKTVSNLGVDLDNSVFRVGMQEGKRIAKSLYVVPSNNDQTDTFQFEKAAKSYTLALPFILRKNKVDFEKSKFTFTISFFEYDGTTALELQITAKKTSSITLDTGKPRGRKSKEKDSVE